MLRVTRLFKLLASTPVKIYFPRTFTENSSSYLRFRTSLYVPRNFYSNKSKDDGKAKKIPSIQDCPTPNLMSDMPGPRCAWEEQDRIKRLRKQKILIVGLLFTAFTVGTLWSMGIMDYKEKKAPPVEKKSKKQKRAVIKNPTDSSEIPKDVPYLLIGGGTASFSAFRAIKSADPTAKVLVITNESFYPYMRPPLSKEIWFNDDPESVRKLIFKQWNGSERSLFYEPDDFYTECKDLIKAPNGGVSVARGWAITKLDVMEKIAYLEDNSEIHYDKCLIATGATPRVSPVFEVALGDEAINDRVLLYRNIYDFEEVSEAFDESKSIAIVGGGFLGKRVSMCNGKKSRILNKKKIKNIYQIFREGGNMGKILPEYLSYWTTDKVKAEGVQVKPNTEVVGVKADKNGLLLTLNNGETLTVDNVIVTVGVEPNTELAKEADLEVDPDLGGFLVNTELQARTDLYIVGGASSTTTTLSFRGRLAGENMTGARKPYYHQSMFWSDLGPDVGYEAIGIVDSSLPTVGVFAKATDQDSPKAVVAATDEGIRSNTEEVPKECDKYLSDGQKKELELARQQDNMPNRSEGEDFGKGVIFYLRNDIVVGIVLWNVFNRMSIARQVLKDQSKYDDLNEVAKLFNIHEE
ncbi:hypothetical protein NQ318_010495 [Aromia moschata]|uniref:Apoptosis-inducing factor 1, mitochondrial n=1 Tax=Aromia moschata TaxID=1265417 RepID=A0AAV8YHB3_9CUCU|nr:hypothetical protein NQ318_010495 [Aromia moschata]